jgi:c-di-GMP-binding flagellar brake protein YcgR
MTSETQFLPLPDLLALLKQAKEAKAPMSLRMGGSNRLLGDLRLGGMEQGIALHLQGAKRRDHLPDLGSLAAISLVYGEEVISFETTVLAPIIASEGDTHFPPVLRVAWPKEGARFQHRQDLRVASPVHRPLDATLRLDTGREVSAQVVNLTETGIGLALNGMLEESLPLKASVDMVMPDGSALHCDGVIRHVTFREGETHFVRLGLVLEEAANETLKRFLQARRTDYSQGLRKAGRQG